MPGRSRTSLVSLFLGAGQPKNRTGGGSRIIRRRGSEKCVQRGGNGLWLDGAMRCGATGMGGRRGGSRPRPPHAEFCAEKCTASAWVLVPLHQRRNRTTHPEFGSIANRHLLISVWRSHVPGVFRRQRDPRT